MVTLPLFVFMCSAGCMWTIVSDSLYVSSHQIEALIPRSLKLLSEHLPRWKLLTYAFLCSIWSVQAFKTLSKYVFNQLVNPNFGPTFRPLWPKVQEWVPAAIHFFEMCLYVHGFNLFQSVCSISWLNVRGSWSIMQQKTTRLCVWVWKLIY